VTAKRKYNNFPPDVTDEDCSAVRYICECVSRRAGFMAAAGITALLKKMDYKDVVSSITGRDESHGETK
jgi:hexokinase